jgi:predicted ATPase
MVPILWDGATDKIDLILEFDMRLPDQFDARGHRYELCLDQIGNSSAFRIGNELLLTYHPNLTEPLPDISRSATRTEYLRYEKDDIYPSQYRSNAIKEDETLLSLIDDAERMPYATEFRYQLGRWQIFHDFRVDRDAEVRRAAVPRPDRTLETDGNNLIPVLHNLYTAQRSFKAEMDEAMQAAFGKEYEELLFPPAEDGRVQLRIKWRSLSRPQSAADLSDGIIRFLALITILANPQPPALIAIDEPENGLHPGMLPIIAEYAQEAARRTQIVVTTHSPEFLDAFSNSSEVVTLVELINGQTVIRRPDKNRLEKWLKAYRLGQLWLSGELGEDS